MADEKEQPRPKDLGEYLDGMYDRMSAVETTEDEPDSDEESTDESASLEEDEATEDEAKAEQESEEAPAPTPATDEEPEPALESPPEPDRPEAVEAPAAGEETDEEADDPEFALPSGKAFRRSDLYDDAKLAEFQSEIEEVKRGWLRETDYHQKRQRDAETVRQVQARFEDAKKLMKQIVADPDMAAIVADFGEGTDVVDRLISRPDLTRAILMDPTQKERLRSALELERERPELRVQREAAERSTVENAQYREQQQQDVIDRGLVEVAQAVKSSIANYAAQDPDVDVAQVEERILGLAGLSGSDFVPGNDEVLRPGLLRLTALLVNVDPATGERKIRPDLIEAEFERQKRLSATAKPATAGAAKAKQKQSAKEEQHNASVKAKLEEDDGPPAVPAGEAPGVRSATRKPKDLSEVSERIRSWAGIPG